jgi:ketosteroid isomerase-like protein
VSFVVNEFRALPGSAIASFAGRERGKLLARQFCAAAAPGTFMKNSAVVLLLLASLLSTSSFATKQKSARASDLLVQLEADFAKAVAERGHEAFVTYFAEDGVELDDGGISSRDAIRKQPPWPEGTSLNWTPVKADMGASGDLGYTYGNYVFKSKDKEGKPVTHYGKYVSIWRKQKDGSWKVVVDMGNSSPAPK